MDPTRCFFFQAEDGIRDLVRSRGLGDVYKRQAQPLTADPAAIGALPGAGAGAHEVVSTRGVVLPLSLIHI